MALSVAGLCVLWLDVLLRRLLFPVILLSAVIFRYNLLSFVYLLLLIVALFLPGPRLKSQKYASTVYYVTVLLFSGLAVLTQSLFQISIASSGPFTPCEGPEPTWRQVGLVQFKSLEAVHVVRLLLPDVMVFLGSLFSLCVTISAVRLCARASEREGAEDTPLQPGLPAGAQCYHQLPAALGYLLDLLVFSLLMLSGVTVPSLLSYLYYLLFLVLLLVWSLHLKLRGLVRALRTAVMVYAVVHLLLLDIYQFQSAQELVSLQPLNSTQSLLARLFGLTPVIETDCTAPWELLVFPDTHFTRFISPVLIMLLLVVLATDFRLWLYTPGLLWKMTNTYCLPVHSQPQDQQLHWLSDHGLLQRQSLWTNYGTTGGSESEGTTTQLDSPAVQSSEPARKHRITWAHVWRRAAQLVDILWTLVLKISFILSIIAMMAWSVLYPSWPSLVLLLWTCVIWLIPKVNPRDSLLYTSPLLVVYALVLLHIQYVYSLDLTDSEFNRTNDFGPECKAETAASCRTGVLLIKTLFTIVFFTSFHEFVCLVKDRFKRSTTPSDHSLDTDGEVPLTELNDCTGRGSPGEDPDTAVARTKVYKSLHRLVSSYWTLVVLAAFLLVTLAGPPSLLKTVYLIFFFLFLITYQVTERYWFLLSFLGWCALILYAVLDLVLIYTYQFTVVSSSWEGLFHNTSFTQQNITDIFDTIGLTKFEISQLSSLAVSLIPPAVFIAVLALQLRYFAPPSQFSQQLEEEASAIDLVSLFPQFLRSAIERVQEEAEEDPPDHDIMTSDTGEMVVLGAAEETGYQQSTGTLERQATTSSDVSSMAPQTRLQSCYKFMIYAFQKTKQLLVELLNLVWRFLELHLNKVIGLTVFAMTITQVSALYWVLLLGLVLFLPVPGLNFLAYPLLTLYLGTVSLAKMIFQTPLVRSEYFDFIPQQPSGEEGVVDRGLVYNDTFSPLTNDAAWIGFHKVTDFANYIALPIVASLFMTLWFSAKRYQSNHRRAEGIRVEPYETGALFLGVTRRSADRSILSSLMFLSNHLFEMYGVEISWAMVAITVAVRIDIYGIAYALLLGVLLYTPRFLLPPVWLLYVLLHGALLLAQYVLLLGAPAGINIFSDSTKYPWSNLTGSVALKKWLFLPGDDVLILDKSLLYADFLVYLLVALYLKYLRRNPIHLGTPDQTNGTLVNFYKLKYWVDYIKVLVFQYCFWVSLFLMFLTAALRVSVFGLLYLLLGLVFLYRGQDLLKNRQQRRHRSWAFLRLVTWLILLVRVCLQIMNCVFLSGVQIDNSCVVLLLFNAVCTRSVYYGSSTADCPLGSVTVGLWVDALNFIVLTLQIMLLDAPHSEQVREELERKEQNAKYFRDVFDKKIEEQRVLSQQERETELQELRERSNHLTETQNKIDHILYAGVYVSDQLVLGKSIKPQASGEEAGEASTGDTQSYGLSDSFDSLAPGEELASPSDPHELEKSGLVISLELARGFLLKVLDQFIIFLESSSVIYRTVVAEVNSSETKEAKPFASRASSYGSTERSPDQEEGHVTETRVEVHLPDQPVDPEAMDMPSGAAGGDAVVKELGIAPTSRERDQIRDYEDQLGRQVEVYSTRPRRFLSALYHMFLSHSEYLVFFLLILNIVLNGSVLSLVYAVLMFGWGLLSIPWPTRRFWISIILYTMLVLVIKYCFQFYDLDQYYWSNHFDSTSGLYPPRILGILHRDNFFANAVWDVLLLIALLIHRSLLKQYGLWMSTKSLTPSRLILSCSESVKSFFGRLLSRELSQGTRDYYPSMLFFDALCFLTIVFGVNSFGIGVHKTKGVAVAEYIQSNYVPLPFVIMLLIQFLSMLVDRAIYLRHSVLAKLVFQVLLLLIWHIWLFFLLPSDLINSRPFTENTAAQCIYFFKCCYFIVSSLQIAAGYPTRILGYLLARSYDIFSWISFLVYRAIPLLPELREVMDWMFTDTVLSLFNWLKVQEIYAQLFLVRVQRERELEFPRALGQVTSWVSKVLVGGAMVAALVLLIWGPLLVMSVITTSNEANPPIEVSIRLTLSGYEPIVRMTAPKQNVVPLSKSEYRGLRDLFNGTPVAPVFESVFLMRDFTRVSFPGVSSSTWSISPPSRAALVQELMNTRQNISANTPLLDFSWSITRTPGTGLATETVSGSSTRQLSYSHDNQTIDSLLDALNSSGVILLRDLYPSLIHAPANDISSNFTELTLFLDPGRQSVSCDVSLNNTGAGETVEWWELMCSHSLTNRTDSTLDLYIYSDGIAPPFFGAIASIGIIGLYVSFVLVIGRFIRTYISDLPTRLYIDEMLHPDPLIKLCQDIFLVRETKDFKMEEILVGKLFYIFKSPDKVGKVTEGRPKIKTD